jgi:hypothetical protein
MQFTEQLSRRSTCEELGIIIYGVVPTSFAVCKFMSSKGVMIFRIKTARNCVVQSGAGRGVIMYK